MAQNLLKEIMQAAGYDNFTDTNRSYFCKSVNKAIGSGMVKLTVVPKGKMRTKANGKTWNISVNTPISGWTSTLHIKGGYITSSEVLRLIGQHLQIPEVKEKISSYVDLHEHCSRCGGAGIIPQFHYYCSGICFECYGTGRSSEKPLVELVKS